MKLLLICAIVTHLFASLATAAEVQCVNAPPGKSDPRNKDLLNVFEDSRAPLITAYRTSLSSASSSKTPCSPCTSQAGPGIETPVQRLNQLTSHLSIPKIKKECIIASMQREPGNVGYTCENNNPKKTFENRGGTAACITDDMANYIHFSVNKAIECMSPDESPIDPRFILAKINNETAFNYFIGYSGGRGIGQLTSPAIKAITGWSVVRKGKRIDVEGEANYLLRELGANDNPSCSPFKQIAQEDLSDPPNLYGKGSNFCEWLGVGEGMTRNLIYALGYYVHIRDNFIEPRLAKQAPKLAKDKDLVNYLTLVAYQSPQTAKTLMDRLRISNSSNPETLKKKIQQQSAYVNQTVEKMGELYKNRYGKNTTSAAELRGDTCVTR